MSETSARISHSVWSGIARMALRRYGYRGLNVVHLFLPEHLILDVLRQHGARVGDDVRIRGPVRFTNASDIQGASYRNLSIGDHSRLEANLFLDLMDHITIEDNVTLAMQVTLITHMAVAYSPLKELYPDSKAPIVVREGAYIGTRVTILHGVEIGRQAVVAAGAVVTKNVPPSTVCGGVPARVLKELKT